MRRRALGTAYAWVANHPGQQREITPRSDGSRRGRPKEGSRTVGAETRGARCGEVGAARASEDAAGVCGRRGNRWTRGSVRRGTAERNGHGGGEGRRGSGARRAAAFLDTLRVQHEKVGMDGEQNGGFRARERGGRREGRGALQRTVAILRGLAAVVARRGRRGRAMRGRRASRVTGRRGSGVRSGAERGPDEARVRAMHAATVVLRMDGGVRGRGSRGDVSAVRVAGGHRAHDAGRRIAADPGIGLGPRDERTAGSSCGRREHRQGDGGEK